MVAEREVVSASVVSNSGVVVRMLPREHLGPTKKYAFAGGKLLVLDGREALLVDTEGEAISCTSLPDGDLALVASGSREGYVASRFKDGSCARSSRSTHLVRLSLIHI